MVNSSCWETNTELSESVPREEELKEESEEALTKVKQSEKSALSTLEGVPVPKEGKGKPKSAAIP